jgi:ABC-type multidrug transport system ATPase subunit
MLQVQRLSKRYGKKLAVDDLSFDVAPGEVLSLLGPNGAGKSTAFLCMAGLVRPDSGTFTWNGEQLGPRRGRTIALIPETPEVYAALTVWEHLVFTAASCNLAEGWQQNAERLLEQFHLTAERDTVGAALSKGMRQKTLIIATLLVDAPVLLFDEPMIGLDPAGQRELREVVSTLREAGKAVMISTHMLESAKAMGDRALILKSGRNIFAGSLQSIATDGDEDIESIFLRITA